jgi:hypothetical protein
MDCNLSWSVSSEDYFQIHNQNRTANLKQEYCGLWCNIGGDSSFQHSVHYFAVRVDSFAQSSVQHSELSSGWSVGIACKDFPITTGR